MEKLLFREEKSLWLGFLGRLGRNCWSAAMKLGKAEDSGSSVMRRGRLAIEEPSEMMGWC